MPRAKTLPIVTSELPIGDTIGVDVSLRKCFHTKCRIVAKFGNDEAELHQNYFWNGADISRFCGWILGVSQYDPRLALASGFHDEGCENAATPQVIADANFIALLGPIIFNGKRLAGIALWRRMGCYIGVRFFALFIRPTTRLFCRKG